MNQDFTTYLQGLYQLSLEMNNIIYGAKKKIYDTTKDPNVQKDVFNQPVVLEKETLDDIVNTLNELNKILETNPAVLDEAKKSVNAKTIKDYYEKISTSLTNINGNMAKDASGKVISYPAFQINTKKEMDRLNTVLFKSPDSFNYPKTPEQPERGIETDAAASLKQKAGLAAGVLRKAINYATSTGQMPSKYTGDYSTNNYNPQNP